jgi:chemotaxis protein methyltransferase CheR
VSPLVAVEDLELELLITAIWEKYHYDFRNYSRASLKRRVSQILIKKNLSSISLLQNQILHDPAFFSKFLEMLTVPVTEMFRDPSFFKKVREEVIPILSTYPSLKIWVAGCSTGEEVYSYAILLHEAGLLRKSLIYGTDINPASLNRAKNAIFESAQIRKFTENYQKSGGTAAFTDYYRADYNAAVLDPVIRQNVVFSDHSLASDQVFSEVNFVSCRNVLIYFDRKLQDSAIGLFSEALCRKGFLALGSKESLHYSKYAKDFSDFSAADKLYQRR